MQQPSGKGMKYFAYGVLISVCGAVLAEYVKGWLKPEAKAGE